MCNTIDSLKITYDIDDVESLNPRMDTVNRGNFGGICTVCDLFDEWIGLFIIPEEIQNGSPCLHSASPLGPPFSQNSLEIQ